MIRVNFTENHDFLVNCTAHPTIIEQGDIQIEPDLSVTITSDNKIIHISDKVFRTTVLPTLGVCGLLRKKMESGDYYTKLLELILPLFKNNLYCFVFFLDSVGNESDCVTVLPCFDKQLNPEPIFNSPEELSTTVCTFYFPVSPEHEYDVIDFEHDPSDKIYTLSLSRPEDIAFPLYPVVHNISPVAWKGNWEQYVSVYDSIHDLYMTLPRNYGKNGYKNVMDIINHTDRFIKGIELNDDYSTEFDEMLCAKLPKSALKWLEEVQFDSKKLSTILQTISSKKEHLKPSKLKAISKCLGFLIAQKLRCCSECRRLDEGSI